MSVYVFGHRDFKRVVILLKFLIFPTFWINRTFYFFFKNLFFHENFLKIRQHTLIIRVFKQKIQNARSMPQENLQKTLNFF